MAARGRSALPLSSKATARRCHGRCDARYGSRIPSESNKGMHDAHTAITHREYVDPADHGIAGRAEAPRLDGGVGTDIRQAVLLQHEVRRNVVENLLGAVVERFQPHAL